MSWDERFKKQSQMEIDFAPLGRLPRPAPILPRAPKGKSPFGSDFQDARERTFIPSPYEEVGMQRGATRYPDYDPFGAERMQSTDLPADVRDFLPTGAARMGKLTSSTDDFSGVGSFGGGGFGSEMGPFGSGKVSRFAVGPLAMVGPPPAYHAPPGPGIRERVVIGADVTPKTPLWAKMLGGIGVFLGGLMAERYLDRKLSGSKPKRRRPR